MGGVQAQTTRGRLTRFVRALYGGTFLQTCPRLGCEVKAGFTEDYGDGFQVRITEKRFAWRGKGDFMNTRLFGRWQNDFRISTGPVILLNRRK